MDLIKPAVRIEQIRKRAAAATPGPWAWVGNTDVHDIYLGTIQRGRRVVMGFRRWGMQRAQPTFSSAPEGLALLVRASEIPVFEVAPAATERTDPKVYRADLRGLRNPDAVFIAAARADVDYLLSEVDRLSTKPDPKVPHKVTVTTRRVLSQPWDTENPNRAENYEWHNEIDYEIDHPERCDALPYGHHCELDYQVDDCGMDDWEKTPGVYLVTLRTEIYQSSEGTEYDVFVDFDPVVKTSEQLDLVPDVKAEAAS
jgi:hypothetical protein